MNKGLKCANTLSQANYITKFMMEITRVNNAQSAMTVSLFIQSPPFEKAYVLPKST